MKFQFLKTIVVYISLFGTLPLYAIPINFGVDNTLTYTDITVDETGLVYVITKTPSDKYAIRTFDGSNWKNITPNHDGSIIYKIMGHSKGIVAMHKEAPIAEGKRENKVMKMWNGSNWETIPLDDINGMIRDFSVDKYGRVWMTGQFWDDAKQGYYYLAKWEKNKMTIEGPPIVDDASLKPFFDKGGKAILTTSGTVHLQLYNRSYNRQTIFAVTDPTGEKRWKLQAHIDYVLLQDITVAAVSGLGDLYVAVDCNGSKNNCILAWNGTWNKLPVNSKYTVEEIKALSFNKYYQMLMAGKIKNAEGKYVILEWNREEFDQFGDGVPREIMQMATYKDKVYAITGAERNNIDVITAYSKEYKPPVNPLPPVTYDGVPVTRGPSASSKTAGTNYTDERSKEVYDLLLKYLVKEKEWFQILTTFWVRISEAKETSEAHNYAIDGKAFINNFHAMISNTRNSLDALKIPAGRNRLVDFFNEKMDLLYKGLTINYSAMSDFTNKKFDSYSTKADQGKAAMEKWAQHFKDNMPMLLVYEQKYK